MANIDNIANDMVQESITLVGSKRVENEDKNITFFGDWAQSISRFSEDEDTGLNLIRKNAGEVMASMASVFSPAATGFNTVVGWRDSVTGVIEALKGLLESLLALDRMLVYQLYRAQNLRFSRTLSALKGSCQRVESHIDAYRAMFDFNGFKPFDFSYYSEDWNIRLGLAEGKLREAYNGGSGIITSEWVGARSDLKGISSNATNLRSYINTRSQIEYDMKAVSEAEEDLKKSLDDQRQLIDNIRKSAAFSDLLKRAIAEALEKVVQAQKNLYNAGADCDFDSAKYLDALGKALSKADAAYLVLSKSDLASLKEYLNLEDLDRDDACLKYALDAYLDDISQANENFPDNSDLYKNGSAYIKMLDDAAATGVAPGSEALSRVEDGFRDNLNTFCKFTEEAEVLQDHFLSGPLSSITEGPISALTGIAEAGYNITNAADLILNARILQVTDFKEFLNAIPAGRLFITVMECLGVSDKLPSGVVMDIATSKSLDDIRKKLESFTGKIDELSQDWAERMSGVFSYFDAIDAEVAAFIYAMTSLLYYCDRGDSFMARYPGPMYSLEGSREDFITGQISSNLYNNAVGDTGALSDIAPDNNLPSTLGGAREDECRC